ncbi:MAG TPA: ChbG/HpnK family deacetylase, partial [Candidatus Hydrogenedentes bacterium]|nr:ChbG/HpnK family deacetylase [Candidatus Hydrogenedentota bacterium]
EWDRYRWGPVAGAPAVPGLVDPDGYLWGDVMQVVTHATPQEVDTELRVQVEKAERMGIKATHLDSHMATLFFSRAYFERYIDLGIEKRIPVLVAGGHLHFLNQNSPVPLDGLREMAERAWSGGLPALDDIHASSYDWKTEDKTDRFIAVLEEMPPGLLEIVIHPTQVTEEFPVFSGSAVTRTGDLNAMTDPRLRRFIVERGVILTTWRELKQRRDQAESAK